MLKIFTPAAHLPGVQCASGARDDAVCNQEGNIDRRQSHLRLSVIVQICTLDELVPFLLRLVVLPCGDCRSC